MSVIVPLFSAFRYISFLVAIASKSLIRTARVPERFYALTQETPRADRILASVWPRLMRTHTMKPLQGPVARTHRLERDLRMLVGIGLQLEACACCKDLLQIGHVEWPQLKGRKQFVKCTGLYRFTAKYQTHTPCFALNFPP